MASASMPVSVPVPFSRGAGSNRSAGTWSSLSGARKFVVALAVLLIVFNVAIPKGGIKAGDLPITWGYLMLFLLVPVGLIGALRRPMPLAQPLLQVILFFLPVALLILVKSVVYHLTFSALAVHEVLFFFLPVGVLVILGPYLEEVPADIIATTLLWCVRFAVIWGIVNFVLYPIIKDIIQIPYLTVNAADYGEIYGKNNRRGILMKLVSTYNNGNIFGACMVMLAPIYFLFEKRRLLLALFIIALVCTLSRTVWFGMVGVTGIMMLTGQIKVRNPRVWIGLVVAGGLLIMLLPLMGWTPEKLVDSNLGGRVKTFTNFEMTVLGGKTLMIPEVIYFGFLNSFGLVGTFFAVCAFAAGPVFGFLHLKSLSPLRRAATAGALGYVVLAAIDGCFVFPPVLAQFFFVTSLIYRRGLRPERKSFSLDNGVRQSYPARSGLS
ncbi:hypothetical protein ACLIMP_05705 [Novosphingobium aerophilum]|uniref:hypothetical protein n=1 Tax=Novosphingobium aerophilum TaxID=2839843 RepID=UPI001C8F22BF